MMRTVLLLLLITIGTYCNAQIGTKPVLIDGEWHKVRFVDPTIEGDLVNFVNRSVGDIASRLGAEKPEHPKIAFTSQEYMSYIYRVLLGLEVKPFAIYFNGTIYLPWDFDLASWNHRSQAYHEAVHHVQTTSGRWNHLMRDHHGCFRALKEGEAYDMQASWITATQPPDPLAYQVVRNLRRAVAIWRQGCAHHKPFPEQ